MCKFCEKRTIWRFLSITKAEYLKNIHGKNHETCVKQGCKEPSQKGSCMCQIHDTEFYKWFMELATDNWLMEPVNRARAKEEWNKLRNHRSLTRRLNREHPTAVYTAKLSIYKDLFQDSPELNKIIVQYLKSERPQVNQP